MKLVEPVSHCVYEIGRNLREADCQEVWLSNRVTGLEAVLQSWWLSDLCRCIVTDAGEPVGITGLAENRIWLLGTDNLVATHQRRLQLCREGGEWARHCLSVAGMSIGNDVYSKNTDSIRWLRHLGFRVAKPRPMGQSSALFCEFWMEF